MINAVKCLNCNVDVPLIWVKKFGNCDSCEKLINLPKTPEEIICDKYPDVVKQFHCGRPVLGFLLMELLSEYKASISSMAARDLLIKELNKNRLTK